MSLPSGLTLDYKYDALGRRIQRTTSAGADERYVYDGPNVLLDPMLRSLLPQVI